MAGPVDTANEPLTTALRRAYSSMGFGRERVVLELFGQEPGGSAAVATEAPGRPSSPAVSADAPGGPPSPAAAWQVVDLVGGGRYRSRDVAADDLFGGIPGHWEVTRVEPVDLKRHGDVVVVTGRIFCRPPGAWELTALPFAHIWTFSEGRVNRVRSYLEGIELRRIERLPAGA